MPLALTSIGHEVLEAVWFSEPRGTIGIVLVSNPHTVKLRSFIGMVSVSSTSTEETDAKHVAEWGAPFPSRWAATVFGRDQADFSE